MYVVSSRVTKPDLAEPNALPARLYFSAKYCPPCRSFAPILAEAYNAHKRHHLQSNVDDDDIEVVSVLDYACLFCTLL